VPTIGAAPVLVSELLVVVPDLQPPRLVAPALLGFVGAGICAVPPGAEDRGCPIAGVPPVPDEGATPPATPVEPDAPDAALAPSPGIPRRMTATIDTNRWRRFPDSTYFPVSGRRSIVMKSIASGFESSSAVSGLRVRRPNRLITVHR
jgi:hypothetical protein